MKRTEFIHWFIGIALLFAGFEFFYYALQIPSFLSGINGIFAIAAFVFNLCCGPETDEKDKEV